MARTPLVEMDYRVCISISPQSSDRTIKEAADELDDVFNVNGSLAKSVQGLEEHGSYCTLTTESSAKFSVTPLILEAISSALCVMRYAHGVQFNPPQVRCVMHMELSSTRHWRQYIVIQCINHDH